MWHIINADCRCPLLDEIISRPSAVMARGRVLKHDDTTTVVAAGDGDRQWVIKRYNTKNRWHAVRRVFRTSRALNCWRAAGWLKRAGIDTAPPVAVLEERRYRVLRGRSYHVCEYVDGDTLESRLDCHEDDALIEQAAGVLLRLHEHGIVHGDLKATNLIVARERVVLVDLDAVRRETGVRLEAGRRKDLQRFLKNWRDRPGLLRQFEARLGRE